MTRCRDAPTLLCGLLATAALLGCVSANGPVAGEPAGALTRIVESGEPMGIAVPLDETGLAHPLRTYLAALSEAGALAKAVWFEDPAWAGSLR